MNTRITKRDVASLAGVSHMTVSRVLNDFPYVSEEKRRRVLKACRKLNYRPNIVASTLRGKKSYAIGVIVPTFRHTFYARLLNSVEETCKRSRYHIIVVQARETDSGLRIEWLDLEFLLARQIDGLLVDLEVAPRILRRLKKEEIPVVFIDVAPGDDSFSFVGTADFEGSREMTNYLIRKGHRKIGFLAGPAGYYTSGRRLAGYKAALRESKISFHKELVLHTDYQTEGGCQAALRLLAAKRKFTALVCANDYIAIGALSALRQKGVKVPEEVSVVGFAGDEITGYMVPPLTTMAQPIEEIGKRAVEMLLDRIEDPKRPTERILLPARLAERNSTRER